MKVLVLGSGAREHAACWKLAKSHRITGLFAAPGNAGMEEIARLLAVDPEDPAAVAAAARENGIELAFVGPEAPLAAGTADALREAGIPVFGPGAASARLESSKAFARAFSDRHGVPSAKSDSFKAGDVAAFEKRINSWKREAARGGRIVLKKSGLAAGKGVVECNDPAQALEFGRKVLEDDDLVVEEFLTGWEMSLHALCGENGYLLLPAAADHKKAGEGDTGPNTGGMGAICPVPLASHAVMERVIKEIVEPTFRGLKAEGLSYRGVLFFGIMVTSSGPKLLEYNVRFGDPECQSLFSLLESDFADLVERVANGKLEGLELRWADRTALGVVVAAPGYPGPCPKGLAVEEIRASDLKGVQIFHAGTSRDAEGRLLTGGGRCFTAVALGEDPLSANAAATEAARRIRFEGAWFRQDIGRRFFKEA